MLNNLYGKKGHNKLGGHISKNVAKIATNWLKISSTATFGQSLGGHNLAIFYPILTTPKWLHLIPFRFWFFEPLFATCGYIGRADPKVPPGCRYLPCLSPQTHCSKSMSQKNQSPNRPPPPPPPPGVDVGWPAPRVRWRPRKFFGVY